MILEPELSLLLMNVPKEHKAKFTRPMSRKARKLVNDMVRWGITFIKKDPQTTGKLVAEAFSAIVYEEAIHLYDTTGYIKLLDKKPKTNDEFIYFFTLQNLSDNKWLREKGLAYNDKRLGLISEPKAVELYSWFTEHFLLSDFQEQDLNKIAFLSQGQFDTSIIKREAAKIQDPDKRNIAYLYAIVRDIAIRSAAIREKDAEVQVEHHAKLRSLCAEHMQAKTKSVFEDDEELSASWSRARSYLTKI